MVAIKYTGDELWARIERGVEKVRERLRRVAAALDASGIRYAVIGGNAVQIWVSQVDEAAVRNTRDVDIILERSQLRDAINSLSGAGFVFNETLSVSMFLDGPEGNVRDAVHVVFAGEKVRPEYDEVVPQLDAVQLLKGTRTLPLDQLVRMKLTSYRLKDQVHLQDMVSVGLIDESFLHCLPTLLRERLQSILDNPDA